MLVIINDIHPTDGSSGKTIKPGIFRKFAIHLRHMAQTAKAKEFEIVLPGDVIDSIRSDYRLGSNVRPQSKVGDKDSEEQGLKDYAIKITDKISKLFSLKDMVNLPLKKFYKKRKKGPSFRSLEWGFGMIMSVV